MTLIERERDNLDLEIEDQAIRDAETPTEPVAPDDLAALIERLTNGDPEATHDR